MHLSHDPVIDTESAATFVAACVDQIGPGYHPDTPFAEYVDGAGGRLDRVEIGGFSRSNLGKTDEGLGWSSSKT